MTDRHHERMSSGPGSAVNVVVDGLAHLGPLSYSVPADLHVRPGDAVEVPVGKRVTSGLVIGPGNQSRATRSVLRRYGGRTTERDLETAELVATDQASRLQQMVARLAPTTGKGAEPIRVSRTFATVTLPETTQSHLNDTSRQLLLLHEPTIQPEDVAAAEASRLVQGGQVLILCPTTALVERVLSRITEGAVRLDAKAARGEWAAFRAGSAPVGVGTRSAAWYAPEKLAAIIVVEEQHPGHREQTAPRHHAREVAMARTQAQNIPLIMTSRNPTPAAMGSGAKVHTVQAQGQPGWPSMRIHNESQDTVRSSDLPLEIEALLEEAAKTSRPLVVVGGRSTRRCMGCFVERAKPKSTSDRCRECGDIATRVLGYDKDRIRDLFGKRVTPVLPHEIDKHRNVGLVVITDLSVMLSHPDLNPYHRAVDAIVSSAAAAGPTGEVVAVVRDPEHPVLRILFELRDQLGIAKRSYRTAQRLQLPPFGKLVQLQILQKSLPDMSGWPGHVHGPSAIKGGWEFVIRCGPGDLPAVQREVVKLRKRKVKIRYHID